MRCEFSSCFRVFVADLALPRSVSDPSEARPASRPDCAAAAHRIMVPQAGKSTVSSLSDRPHRASEAPGAGDMIVKHVAVFCVCVAVCCGPAVVGLAAQHEVRLADAAARGRSGPGARPARASASRRRQRRRSRRHDRAALGRARRSTGHGQPARPCRGGCSRQGSLRHYSAVSGGGERQRGDDPDAARRRRRSQQRRADRRNRADDGEPHRRPRRHAPAARLAAPASTRATPSSRRRR